MDLGLRDRVALVLGGSRGLGHAVARALAREGAVVAFCSRSAENLERAVQALDEQLRGRVHPFVADVRDGEQLRTLYTRVEEAVGAPQILVTNAGGPPSTTFESTSDEQWNAAVELTLLSVVRAVRLALPAMKRARWGRIINLTSISVKQPIPGLLLSNAIRAAVIGLAKTLADELAPHGITVNNVCPGFTRTERLEELAAAAAARDGVAPEAIFQRWIDQIPVGRLGEPSEVAALVTFLAGEPAAFITGASILVDGGHYRGLT